MPSFARSVAFVPWVRLPVNLFECGLPCAATENITRRSISDRALNHERVIWQRAMNGLTMSRADIFHPDFAPEPYWWEAYRPVAGELAEVPAEARVAIVGGGYAGLAAGVGFSPPGVCPGARSRRARAVAATTPARA